MATSMHRLQISLTEEQTEFLTRQAQRHRMSMAEVVRRLINREAEIAAKEDGTGSIWDIAGIAEDQGPLIDGVPVSEKPEVYLSSSLPSTEDGRR
jgi:hypothetical protein